MVKKTFYFLVFLLILMGMFPFFLGNNSNVEKDRIPDFNGRCEFSAFDSYQRLNEIGAVELFQNISFRTEMSFSNYICHGKIIGSNVSQGLKLEDINSENLELTVVVNLVITLLTIVMPLFFLFIVSKGYALEKKKYDFNRYRPEIDGLRTIAVVLVVAYHLGIKNFSGGYIGVDVFLVISGFLISSIIYTKHNNNEFELKSFYIRRAKRLIPAVLGTIVIIFIPVLIFLNPSSILKFSESSIATIFYVSNIFFWYKKQDYFFGFGGDNPLEHTWSLSLEEQYYLIWPLLFIFLLSYKKWFNKYIIIFLSIVSIYFSEAIVSGSSNLFLSNLVTNFTNLGPFYLIQFRFWEFLFGTLLIFTLQYQLKNKWVNDALIFIGMLIIFWYSTNLNNSSPFPGLTAVYVCIGTFLILQATNSKYINNLLGSKPFEWIGKRSYSIYLIHWPFIVIYNSLEIRLEDYPKDITLTVLLLLILFVSDFLYKNVENRFRENKHELAQVDNRVFIKRTTGISIVIVSFMFLISSNPLYFSLNNKEIKEAYRIMIPSESVDWSNRDQIISDSACKLFDELLYNWDPQDSLNNSLGTNQILECLGIEYNNTLFVGDSMVEDLYVTAKLYRDDINPVLISKCDFFALNVNSNVDNCVKRKQLIQYLINIETDKFSQIIYRVRGDKLMSSENNYMNYEYKDYYVEENLNWALELNSKVDFIWIGPGVEHRTGLPNILWGSKSLEDYKKIASQQEIESFYVLDKELQDEINNSGITYISVIETLCRVSCPVLENNISLFIDEVHWSINGMKVLGSKILDLVF